MHNDWIARIVVLLSFSPTFSCFHSKNSLCTKESHLVIQKVESDAVNASIKCTGLHVNKENFNIMLHKKLHITDFQKTQVTNTSEENQRFSMYVKNESVAYVIDMPQINDTGLYTCTVAHRQSVNTTYTVLLVTDPGLQSCPNKGQSVSWVLLAVGCGILALYNFITTIASCSYVWKLKNLDTYQNDYINTRPGEFSRGK